MVADAGGESLIQKRIVRVSCTVMVLLDGSVLILILTGGLLPVY